MTGADNALMLTKEGPSMPMALATDFRAPAVRSAVSGVGEIRRGLPRTNKPASTFVRLSAPGARAARGALGLIRRNEGTIPKMTKMTVTSCHAEKRALLEAARLAKDEDARLDRYEQVAALDALMEKMPLTNSRDAEAYVYRLCELSEMLLEAEDWETAKERANSILVHTSKLDDYFMRLDPAIDDIPLRRAWDVYGRPDQDTG